MVLDARIWKREALVEYRAHHPLGFDQGFLGRDVRALTPSLIRELLILHDLRKVGEPAPLKVKRDE